MLLPMNIYSEDCRFVVDTGSPVTLISSTVFNKIASHTELNLRPTDPSFKINVADETPLKVEGIVNIPFKVRNTLFHWDMYVVNIRENGLIGLDFLYENDYSLGARTGLRLNKKRYPCILEEIKFCSNILCTDTVKIPAKSEIVIGGQLETKTFNGEFGVISKPCSLKVKNILIGNTLVDMNKSNTGLPVRILNSSVEDVTLRKGTVIGKLEEVSNIIPFENNELNVEPDRCGERTNDKLDSGKELPDHVKELFDRSAENLNLEQSCKLSKLLYDNADLFAKSSADLGKTSVVEHTINTGDARPIKQAARRPPKSLAGKENEIIQDQIKAGVIRESSSPWASPMVYVMKKDGSIRPCVDYRKLNDCTLKDAYPLPRMDDCLDSFGNAKYFSTLDLQSGYWQVSVSEKDKSKTAFVTRSGLYEYNQMPFGLCNAPSTFQRCMELVFRGLQWKILLIYLDDIIIFSETFETHLDRINQVFGRLRQAGFKLKSSKCELFRSEVTFLGHSVTSSGIKPSMEKVKVVQNWKRPQTLTQVRSFLGFASYYRRYIRNFSTRAAPLNRLLEAGQAFIWTDDCENAFKDLKSALTGEEVMAFPEDEGLFILDTDASDIGIGGVLSQIQYCEELQKEIERPISFASKSLTKTQRRYCVTRRELLAVVTFIQHYKQFLLGRKFVVRTDHSALRWVMSFREPENQTARWLEILSQYDFTIVHRQGQKHKNADFLSRSCEPSVCDCYDGQTVLSDLPCSGCSDCLKKHEQWSSFMKEDDVVPMKLNRTFLEGKERSERVKKTAAGCATYVLDYVMWLVLTFFLVVMKLPKAINLCSWNTNSRARDISIRNMHPSSSRLEMDTGIQYDIRLPSYITGYSRTDLAKIQKNDPEVGTVIKWKELNEERPTRESIASESPFTRHLWLLWDQLILIDGILYKQWFPKLKGQCFLQLIAPRRLWKELLQATHDSKFSGHLGVKKVLSKLKLNFYWLRMKEYVRLWIQKCIVCGRRKGQNRKPRAPLGKYIVGAPMDRVATDITGPFPVSERGSRYILVVQDQFSKWVEAYAIKDQSAQTVAHVLVYEFFSRMGLPIELHSDQGSNYGSELFKEICKILDIHKTRTSPYHPSGNGMVEVFNKTLLNMISAYVDENQKDWDLHLPLLTSAYRACAHDSSGLSPNLVMLGREVHQPISLVYGIPGLSDNYVSPVEYVCDLWNKMNDIQAYVHSYLGIAAEKQKRDYDSRISVRSYGVGDLVFVYDGSRKVGLNPKLRSQLWKGPFIIKRKMSDLLYELVDHQLSKSKLIHHDRLKPYNSDIFPDWVPNVRKSVLCEVAGTPINKTARSKFTNNSDETDNSKTAKHTSSDSKAPQSVGNNDRSRPQRPRRSPKRYGYD